MLHPLKLLQQQNLWWLIAGVGLGNEVERVLLFSSFFLYCIFYHLPFVTLSTYFHFLSLFIFSRVILLLICKIQFAFFRLENDLGEIETSSNFIASFYLKKVFIYNLIWLVSVHGKNGEEKCWLVNCCTFTAVMLIARSTFYGWSEFFLFWAFLPFSLRVRIYTPPCAVLYSSSAVLGALRPQSPVVVSPIEI